MTIPSPQMKLLQDILQRNLPPDTGLPPVNIYEESWQWFYFDNIVNADDLEKAWAIFPEQAEIRRRLADLEAMADSHPNSGYRLPKKSNRCSDKELQALIERTIESYRPLILDRDYNAETRR